MGKKILVWFLVLALLCGAFAGCAKKPLTPVELMSLGEKYLMELDYENAVVQFLKVIEIEPMNVRAYQGAAKAYNALGKQDEALAILETGFAATNSAEIAASMEEARPAPVVEAESEPDSVVEADTVPEPEPVSTNALTPQDLAEWGLPYGTDVAGALAKYPSDEAMPLLRDLQANPSVSQSYMASYTAPAQNVNVYIYIGSEKLANVTWLENSMEPAPKGIRMGMSMAEVFRMLNCTDPESMAFAENPSSETFDKLVQQDAAVTSFQLGSSEVFLSKDATSGDYKLYVPCLDTQAALAIQFENGVVSSRYGSLFVWYEDN